MKAVANVSAPITTRSHSDANLGATTREAWTAFWQEPDQLQCLAGAADVCRILSDHWAAFADSLPPGARILDLGCGAGAVARALAAERRDTQVTGVDFARLPLTIQEQFELLSETEMEDLPFADASFAAAVSQWGYEYSDTRRAARELARVLAPNARFSFVVHHSASSIVAIDRDRSNALKALDSFEAAFCSGDSAAFAAQIASLTSRYPQDRLIVELERALRVRIERPPRERIAIWKAVKDALEPERRISAALQSCCVAPGRIDDWAAPLREVSKALSVSALHAATGGPIAWKVDGVL